MALKPIHLLLGAAAAGGAYLLLKKKPAAAGMAGTTEAAPVQVASAKDFDLNKALNIVLDDQNKTVTVKPGQSIVFSKAVGGESWADPGVVSSNPLVLAPSVPATITGFIATGLGYAQVTGYYFADDGSGLQAVRATILVTATGN